MHLGAVSSSWILVSALMITASASNIQNPSNPSGDVVFNKKGLLKINAQSMHTTDPDAVKKCVEITYQTIPLHLMDMKPPVNSLKLLHHGFLVGEGCKIGHLFGLRSHLNEWKDWNIQQGCQRYCGKHLHHTNNKYAGLGLENIEDTCAFACNRGATLYHGYWQYTEKYQA